ncbi:MAG: SRPBCC domain-containing protein [Planctomycetota bacterium]
MSANPSDTVRLTRLIRAPREKVYQAFVDPEVIRRWWRCEPDWSCPSCAIDATTGGAYRTSMADPQGKPFTVFGEFLELDPPNRLRFSWNWEHAPEFGAQSVVTVEFYETVFDDQPATELVLTHERLNTPHERSEHTIGWMGGLGSLAAYFHTHTSVTA